MIINWFNDTNKTQKIFLNDLHDAPIEAQPQSLNAIEIEIPEGRQLFIKEWSTGIVLISAIF